ncbi:divalent-cation tolerance protein CutA [archaeon]|nr:divalent-cation tolerance protein CutA [archaeon]MBL7057262.1 divalent-cation tolerance protein CutA [Candidatus Woesearchaeota archaeon]
MIIYYTTCKNKIEAKKIAKALLKDKLIACANIFEVNSLYEWDGKMQDHNEAILWVKTIDRRTEEVKDAIRKLHSYDIPAIVEIKTRVNAEYLAWVESQIK